MRIKSRIIALGALMSAAGLACARELPDDTFAGLSPPPSKPAPAREYTGMPVGGWLFYPALTAGVVYDDNIFQSPTNRTSAFGARVVPSANLVRDDGIHKVTIYGTTDGRFYSGGDTADTVTARAGFLHSYQAAKDLEFRVQADYTRQTDPFNGAANFNNNITVSNPFSATLTSNPFPYNQFSGSASVTKMFTDSFISARAAVTHISYDNSNGSTPTNTSLLPPPDGTIYSVTTRAGYWVSPLFYVYVEPMLDWRNYSGAVNRSSGYRITGGLATDRIGLFRGEIFAGYQLERSEQAIGTSPSSTASGTVLGLRLNYEATHFLTLRAVVDETLGLSQFNDPTAPPGTQTRLSTASLQADYAMAREWMLSGRFGYTKAEYLSGLINSREDDGWFGALKYSYTFNTSFGMALEYQYFKLNSNVAPGFTRNVITLSGTYRY